MRTWISSIFLSTGAGWDSSGSFRSAPLVATLVLFFVFRKNKQPIFVTEKTAVTDYFPTALLIGTVVLLILASFLPDKPAATNGIICISLFVIGLIRQFVTCRDFKRTAKAVREIDFFTLFLLAGLFVVIAGMTEAGVVDAIASFFITVSQDNLFALYSLLVWASVFFSAFIDNIPYIATMLPRRHKYRGDYGHRPDASIFRASLRGDAGRKPDAHWRFRQYHGAGDSAPGGDRRQLRTVHEDQRALYAGRRDDRLSAHLADLVLIRMIKQERPVIRQAFQLKDRCIQAEKYHLLARAKPGRHNPEALCLQRASGFTRPPGRGSR